MFTILADSMFTASRKSSETPEAAKPKTDRFTPALRRTSDAARDLRVTEPLDGR